VYGPATHFWGRSTAMLVVTVNSEKMTTISIKKRVVIVFFCM